MGSIEEKNRKVCLHKFYNDLKLEYVNWEVRTLFIGTFNPICCPNNQAEWFYGRTINNMFWDTIGLFYENNDQLGQNGDPFEWKEFCKRNKLAVTDLIFSIEMFDFKDQTELDNLCDFSDKKLENYLHNGHFQSNFVEVLIENSPKLKSLKCVYLTRSTVNYPWNLLWNPISHACQERGINYSKLLTPGGYNYFQFNQNDFPRTPQNLLHLWQENYGLNDCR